MKKYFLVSIILLFCILLVSCSNSKDSITLEIDKEIKSITIDNKYVSITKTEYDSSIYRIELEFLIEAQSFDYVKSFTDAVCKDCYRILKKHNINRSIFVWGYYPRGIDFVTMYGRTYYSKSSGKFEFKTAKELNL
ncbi:hypothetical protein ES695_14800 [Candidatus Atribacteria bacterium 1244-E10-H5-B2]|nr:MAG: hypothetical protein ES695_14800 [Candidatus Atribacteria bacterium 1244-E10-H5-B2]